MTESSTDRKPHTLADDLGAAIAGLSELLRAETAAVEARRDDDLTRFLSEKRAAAKNYRALAQQLVAEADTSQSWSAGQRKKLEQGLREMRETIRTNARTLQANIEAGRQLMNAVDRAVQGRTAAGFSYDHDARAKVHGIRQRSASVLFNQVA
jgi:hypothetical protein